MNQRQYYLLVVLLGLSLVLNGIVAWNVTKPFTVELPKRQQLISRTEKLCIEVVSGDLENSRCEDPQKSGVVVTTLPGPDGYTVGINFSPRDNKITITMVPPGVFPDEGDHS